MVTPRGRTVPLSLAQRLVSDLVRAARPLPLRTLRCPVPLPDWPGEEPPCRTAWCALLVRAFAAVAADWPELRRAYLPFPRPRLYEHPFSVAAVAVERMLGTEEALLFVRVRQAEQWGVRDLARHLRRCTEGAPEAVATFRHLLRRSRCSLVLRRLLWWHDCHWSGTRRARRLGTFAVLPHADPEGLPLPLPLTCTLGLGAIVTDGTADVALTFDERVLSAGRAATVLDEVAGRLGYGGSGTSLNSNGIGTSTKPAGAR